MSTPTTPKEKARRLLRAIYLENRACLLQAHSILATGRYKGLHAPLRQCDCEVALRYRIEEQEARKLEYL